MQRFGGGGSTLPVTQVNILLLSILLLTQIAGCVSAPTVVGSETGGDGKPKWVTEGSATLKTHTKRLFHGVGTAAEKGDLTQQTTNADNQARAELSRIVSSYFEISARNYIASGKADQSQFTQQILSQFISEFTQENLRSVYVADHWHDAQSDVIYSVAELSLLDVRKLVANTKHMHEGFRHYLQSEADVIFDQIARGNE